MPLPTVSDVHVNQLLTQMSVAYVQAGDNFVAPKVFPRLDVKKQSDLYAVWSKADFMRLQAQKRADGAEAVRAAFALDTSNSYFAEPYALKKGLTDKQRANYDVPLNADRTVVNFLTHQMLMKRDAIWAAKMFTTGVWGTDINGGDGNGGTLIRWSTGSTSTPIENVRAAKRVVHTATGFTPNCLVVGPEVDDALRDHPDIVDRIKYTQKGIVTAELIAELFDVKQYLVAKAVHSTAKEGAAVAMANIFGKHALLCYVTDGPSLEEPSAGYTFSWSQFDKVTDGAAAIKSWRDEAISGDWFEAEMAFDFKAVATDCGYFFNGIVV